MPNCTNVWKDIEVIGFMFLKLSVDSKAELLMKETINLFASYPQKHDIIC